MDALHALFSPVDAAEFGRNTRACRPRGRLAWVVVLTVAVAAVSPFPASSQSVISGRIQSQRFPGSTELMYHGGILVFGSLDGPGIEARGFRSWETEPAGWYRISGPAGNYTLLFTQPAGNFRPVVLNNIFTRPFEKLDPLRVSPHFDYFDFYEHEWDTKPATDYFQIFVARGQSLTQVGFKLATDGVDGGGPRSQNMVLSVHRKGPGTPDTWEQVGPAVAVPDVDCGGPKSYAYCGGWNSGEVPLSPGQTYAVRLRPETPGNTLQAWWHKTDDAAGYCYRLGADYAGFTNRCLWMAIGTDDDGLLLPYNKRVHKQFGAFAGFSSKWTQTYVAQGRSMAAALLYAAVGGAQPPLSRQRAVVRVRRGGPDGPVAGVEKIAIGNGNYTGDASWGCFGVAYAPGEVLLTPGETYGVEFESVENYETLHGFVNIKGQVSDDRPGFNPYRKHPRDSYARGTAFKAGHDVQDFDLDMQILEYEFAATNWALATDAENLLRNGGMEDGELKLDNAGSPDHWKPFAIDPGTAHLYLLREPEKTNRIARISCGGNGKAADGGWVQRVEGLDHFQTYRLAGWLRASWPADSDHQCFFGYDPTGQDTDPRSTSIVWSAALPGHHGHFLNHTCEPIRPTNNAVSVWLRARTTFTGDKHAPFKGDFDEVSLRRVRTEAPSSR
jgi:hypothetical protein